MSEALKWLRLFSLFVIFGSVLTLSTPERANAFGCGMFCLSGCPDDPEAKCEEFGCYEGSAMCWEQGGACDPHATLQCSLI